MEGHAANLLAKANIDGLYRKRSWLILGSKSRVIQEKLLKT